MNFHCKLLDIVDRPGKARRIQPENDKNADLDRMLKRNEEPCPSCKKSAKYNPDDYTFM